MGGCCHSLRNFEVLLAVHDPHSNETTHPRPYVSTDKSTEKATIPLPDHLEIEWFDDNEGVQPSHIVLGGDSQLGNHDTSRYSRGG